MKRNLHFCIVSTFYPPYNFGGDGIYAHRLANGLAERGHRVTVLHCPDAYQLLTTVGPRGDNANHPNVDVHAIRVRWPRLGLLAVHQTGRPCLQGPQLRRWLNRVDYDVIHYNNCSLLGGPTVFTYGRALKLCTLIEHWLVCPLHVLWKYNRQVCTKPTCVRCTLRGKRPVQWWRYTGLMKRCTRAIDAFVAPSEFTSQEHRRRGLQGRFVRLPLFHSESRAPSASDNICGERPFFLFVGRLEKIKGLQELIPVFRDYPSADLLVAGAGTYAAQLRSLASGMGNVRFLGRVEQQELAPLYRQALAVIVPSICYETFGIIVVESFAAGTPVIVNDLGALPELVRRHGGGLIYGATDELRHAMERLQQDTELRDRLGAEGKAAYLQEYAQKAFIDHYLDVVEQLLDERTATDVRNA